mmetsp:Transcript_1983/g.5483  ORF Transcript_1983/g.5483 Transcript_1983/m.5483 type:complete len:235 (+) Transcript_1983:507-1211(+)
MGTCFSRNTASNCSMSASGTACTVMRWRRNSRSLSSPLPLSSICRTSPFSPSLPVDSREKKMSRSRSLICARRAVAMLACMSMMRFFSASSGRESTADIRSDAEKPPAAAVASPSPRCIFNSRTSDSHAVRDALTLSATFGNSLKAFAAQKVSVEVRSKVCVCRRCPSPPASSTSTLFSLIPSKSWTMAWYVQLCWSGAHRSIDRSIRINTGRWKEALEPEAMSSVKRLEGETR